MIEKNTFEYDVECFYEVDEDYPQHLHDLRNDCPLASDSIAVSVSMFRDLTFKLKYGRIAASKVGAKFNAQENYVVYRQCLKLHLELGMKLANVDSVEIYSNSSAQTLHRAQYFPQKAI